MQVKTPIRKASLSKLLGTGITSPDSLISAPELSDNCISKFTSLLRARDLSSSAKPLWNLDTKWKQQVLPLKLTKSNSTSTTSRKVKDQPLQRISINGTEIIRNLG